MNNKNNVIKTFEGGCRGKLFLKSFPLLLTILLLLTSCGGGVPEDEAAGIVRELVEASLPLNEIYFGEGMPVRDDEDAILYAYVADDAPYLTEAALREGTLEVFTSDYAGYLFRTFLTGYSSGEKAVYARYIENGDRLTMRIADDVDIFPPRGYDFDSVRIISTSKNLIRAEITSLPAENDPAVTVSVTVRLEPSGWRLDSPTY